MRSDPCKRLNPGKIIQWLIILSALAFGRAALASDNPTASVKTNSGAIEIELFPKQAPITVANFIKYAEQGYYNGTVFHRVIPGFMIQGGGFDTAMNRKPTLAPIRNESDNGLQNQRGTIAMARTSDPDSATSQFFINVVNNHYLNRTENRAGYAVFGKVVKGMDVVDKISLVKTGIRKGMKDVPVNPVVIEAVTIKYHDFP